MFSHTKLSLLNKSFPSLQQYGLLWFIYKILKWENGSAYNFSTQTPLLNWLFENHTHSWSKSRMANEKKRTLKVQRPMFSFELCTDYDLSYRLLTGERTILEKELNRTPRFLARTTLGVLEINAKLQHNYFPTPTDWSPFEMGKGNS